MTAAELTLIAEADVDVDHEGMDAMEEDALNAELLQEDVDWELSQDEDKDPHPEGDSDPQPSTSAAE